MSNQSWGLCPICNNKTRTKIRDDTELINSIVPLDALDGGIYSRTVDI